MEKTIEIIKEMYLSANVKDKARDVLSSITNVDGYVFPIPVDYNTLQLDFEVAEFYAEFTITPRKLSVYLEHLDKTYEFTEIEAMINFIKSLEDFSDVGC
jgi:hypothetical protein